MEMRRLKDRRTAVIINIGRYYGMESRNMESEHNVTLCQCFNGSCKLGFKIQVVWVFFSFGLNKDI